jgi:hypothetical protein
MYPVNAVATLAAAFAAPKNKPFTCRRAFSKCLVTCKLVFVAVFVVRLTAVSAPVTKHFKGLLTISRKKTSRYAVSVTEVKARSSSLSFSKVTSRSSNRCPKDAAARIDLPAPWTMMPPGDALFLVFISGAGPIRLLAAAQRWTRSVTRPLKAPLNPLGLDTVTLPAKNM